MTLILSHSNIKWFVICFCAFVGIFDVGLADKCRSPDDLDKTKFQVAETNLLRGQFNVTVKCQENYSPAGNLMADACEAKGEAYEIKGTCIRKPPT